MQKDFSVKGNKKGLYTMVVATLMLAATVFVVSNKGLLNVGGPNAAISTILYVSTTGKDTNAGTKAAPFKTIQRAITVAKPGYEIRVASGTYPEFLTVKDKKGTKDSPIIIVGEETDVAKFPIISGGDPTYAKNDEKNGISVTNSSWVQFERIKVQDVSNTAYYISNSNYIIIRRNYIKFNAHGIRLKDKSNHILVEFSEFTQNLPKTFTWTTLKGSKWEGSAITSYGGAGMNEYRYNYFHDAFNGILMDNDTRKGNYYDANVFIHHNRFVNIVDDPYEPETYAFNNHFYNNVLINTHRLLSVAPGGTQKLGPIYVYGNYQLITKDPTNEAAKGRTNSALKVDLSSKFYPNGVYFFNNTVDLNQAGTNTYGIDVLSSKINKLTVVNNIFTSEKNNYSISKLTLTNSILGTNLSQKAFGYKETGSWENTNPELTDRTKEDGRLKITSPAKGKSRMVSVTLGFTQSPQVVAGIDLGAYSSATKKFHLFPTPKYEVPTGGEMSGFPANVAWPADNYTGAKPKYGAMWESY